MKVRDRSSNCMLMIKGREEGLIRSGGCDGNLYEENEGKWEGCGK